MSSVNKVIIVGRLGNDPDVRSFSNGGGVTNISVATSEQWTDKNTGERREQTEWHRISLFNRLGEIAAQYLRKGSMVYIEGSLQTRKYTDQQGIERYTTEIRASEMRMLSPKSENQSSGQGGGFGGNQNAQSYPNNNNNRQNNSQRQYNNQNYHNQGNMGYDNGMDYMGQGGAGFGNQGNFNHQGDMGVQGNTNRTNHFQSDNFGNQNAATRQVQNGFINQANTQPMNQAPLVQPSMADDNVFSKPEQGKSNVSGAAPKDNNPTDDDMPDRKSVV